MAHTMTYELETTRAPGLAGWLARTRKALDDRRLYRRTLDELSALSDRELADLGLSRLSVRDIAYESVYGR
jgi:uncharacterized protein YjiS (DUF1127 family)